MARLRFSVTFGSEIDYDKTDAIRGLDVAISTSAVTDEEALALLSGFKFPFRQN